MKDKTCVISDMRAKYVGTPITEEVFEAVLEDIWSMTQEAAGDWARMISDEAYDEFVNEILDALKIVLPVQAGLIIGGTIETES